MEFKHMKGDDRVKIVMYALSTCIWCRKTKRLLNNLGVAYDYVDVDLLEGEEKETAQNDLKTWNPKGSFPTLVFDDTTCVVGFNEEKIREALVHE